MFRDICYLPHNNSYMQITERAVRTCGFKLPFLPHDTKIICPWLSRRSLNISEGKPGRPGTEAGSLCGFAKSPRVISDPYFQAR